MSKALLLVPQGAIQFFLNFMLPTKNVHPVTVTLPEQARFSLARDEVYDLLVVSLIHFPESLDLIREAKTQHPKLRILVIHDYDETRDLRSLALQAGASATITTPLNVGKLSEVLHVLGLASIE